MKPASTKGIDQMDYVMYTKEHCPYCKQAEALFDYFQCKVEYRYMPCDEWPTFPAIYKVHGDQMELIGGFNELRGYITDYGA